MIVRRKNSSMLRVGSKQRRFGGALVSYKRGTQLIPSLLLGRAVDPVMKRTSRRLNVIRSLGPPLHERMRAPPFYMLAERAFPFLSVDGAVGESSKSLGCIYRGGGGMCGAALRFPSG